MYKNFIKPVFDSLSALCGLILLSPILILVTIFLFFANNGKPFFYQLRPGKNGKIFKIVKFKTMNDRKDANGNLLPDAERLTKIGTFVRKSSLDEIPQLWNVLKGDMSLIGPRPLLTGYYHLYNDFQNRRHEVKPGITGWAQVNGRNAISWDEKFKLDVWYVDNISFILDIKIMIRTFLKVIKREGISAQNAATIEPFGGNNLYLYGASGHCKVVVDILKSNKKTIDSIIDDYPKVDNFAEIPVLKSRDFEPNDNLIIAIGNNKTRKRLIENRNVKYEKAVHKTAIVSSNSKIGEGTVVMAGVIINPNANIGNHCIINTGAIIEHDCKIDDFVHISPGVSLAGGVSVGEGSHVGIGSSVIQEIKIGKWATIGAGAVIIKDIPDYAVVVGNPGKIIKYNQNEG